MTTLAYKQYTNIPYGGYVSAPVIGPLSTNRTPLIMPRHNYGELPENTRILLNFIRRTVPVNFQTHADNI